MPESEGFIVKNNVESTVADNPLTAGATTLHVAAGQGSRFPAAFPFRLTIWDDVVYPDPTDDSGMEIVECTARTTDALTIARGKEGTSGVGHANSERVAMLITAGIFDDPTYGIITKLNGIEDNATADQTKVDIDALGIDADKVDGCHAGTSEGDVWKIADEAAGSIYYQGINGVYSCVPSTNGYHLTTHGASQAPTWEAPYSHPSARQCTTGNWAWASISGKPSTFPPSAHNQSAATITSDILAVARGGTGVSGDTYDAKYVSGCIPGLAENNVFKIYSFISDYGVFYKSPSPNGIATLMAGTNGYQLTTHSTGSAPTWAAASDLIFSDTYCPKCGLEFQDGDDLILHVIGHNEVGDILTIPMHQSCVNDPKKTVTIKRKVMEDRYIFDELTGEQKVQRVRKTQEKTVIKKRIKEDVELDNKTGDFWQLEDGKRKKKITSAEATEEFEEIISEVEYEDIEYAI